MVYQPALAVNVFKRLGCGRAAARRGQIVDILKKSMELEDKRGKGKTKAPPLQPAMPRERRCSWARSKTAK